MLTCSSLCDDALLSHPFAKKSLSNRVIDLVRSGMQKVFPLKIDFCSAEELRKTLSEI